MARIVAQPVTRESGLSVCVVRVQLVTRVRIQYVTVARAQPMTGLLKAQCFAGIGTQNVLQIKKQSVNVSGTKT